MRVEYKAGRRKILPVRKAVHLPQLRLVLASVDTLLHHDFLPGLLPRPRLAPRDLERLLYYRHRRLRRDRRQGLAGILPVCGQLVGRVVLVRTLNLVPARPNVPAHNRNQLEVVAGVLFGWQICLVGSHWLWRLLDLMPRVEK